MTLPDLFNLIWPLVVAILIASVPGVWALIAAANKYKSEGGHLTVSAEVVNKYINAANQAAEYASRLQDRIDSQDAKIEANEAEISSLKSKVDSLEREVSSLESQLETVTHLAEIRNKDCRTRADDAELP